MPPVRSTTLNTYLAVYHTASDFLGNVSSQLYQRERSANIVLAHAEKVKKLEAAGKPTASGQFWIACWSNRSANQASLDFVLSCTESHMGTYPIFVYATQPTSALTPTYLDMRMNLMAKKLLDLVPPERVFSIFGLAPVTKSLAAAWTHLTGFVAVEEPYYSCTSTFLTEDKFKSSRQSSDPSHSLRKATMADLDRAAKLCQEFAATSPPFTLNDEAARKEAQVMIEQGQMWVYEMSRLPEGPRELASIVCVTRTTKNVAAVTKVYTNPDFRKRGCADRLLSKVCQHLFKYEKKTSIVLYVGHTLDAVRVYDRVGFAGLCGTTRDDANGVEDWLEIGFEDATVGHW